MVAPEGNSLVAEPIQPFCPPAGAAEKPYCAPLIAAERSQIMAAVKSKNTSPEMIVRRSVHKLGYRYRLHVTALPGAPDLVFPRLKKIILVSGCFWHGHTCGACRIPATRRSYWVAKIARNTARDQRTHRQLNRLGWRVLVVWECQTKRSKQDHLQMRLASFLANG
jgi:DNA mismatch endonuclease, patch repair protein